MNRAIKLVLTGLIFTISAPLLAQNGILEKDLGVLDTLPVSQVIKNSEDEPISIINTGVIVNSLGLKARGPHHIIFELAADASFPVVVNGHLVEVGGSYAMSMNLTDSGHKFSMPVYPAVNFVEGEAPYQLKVPNINVEACPTTFTERETDCYKVEFLSLTYQCPESYSYSGGDICERIIETDKINQCPDNYSRVSENRCERNISKPFTYACADNEEVRSGECVSIYTESANYCEDGFERQADGSCLASDGRVSAAGNYCNAGFTYDPQVKTCMREETQSAVKECSSGYSLSNDGSYCERVDFITLALTCEENYSISGDGLSCVQEFTVAANQSCPDGAEWTKDGTSCRYFNSKNVSSCPSGMTLKNGSCHDVRSKWQSCPSGYTNNNSGSCVKNESKAAAKSCASGYTMKSGVCTKTTTTSTTPSCKSGWTYSSGKCTSTDNLPKVPKTCPIQSNYTYYGRFCFGTIYSKTETMCKYKDNEHCGGSEHVVPRGKTCPSGSTETGSNLCKRTLEEAPNQVCPSGYTKVNSSTCSRTVTSATQYSCSSGWSRSGTTCSRTLTESVNYYCASNWSSHSSTQCYANSADLKKGSCSSGYSLNESNGNCERAYSQEVSWSCPSGPYTLNKPSCDFYDEHAPFVNCPNSFTERNGQCERSYYENVQHNCPDMFTPQPSQDRCFREHIVPKL